MRTKNSYSPRPRAENSPVEKDVERKMRRLVAEGKTIGAAVAQASPEVLGAQGRIAKWKDLQAQKLGMTTELWALLSTPGITDVLINGTQCWIDQGNGCELAQWAPKDDQQCRALAVQMAAAAGRRLDEASPMVDAFLADMIRLHAVLPPLAKPATFISLRVLRTQSFSIGDLVGQRMFTEEIADVLVTLVQEHKTMLISGATGTGKTTLLAALLEIVEGNERIICIEEVSELFPAHPHVVHLQERPSNIEGEGEIGLGDLVRTSLRMRPDRLVLGECRGAEIREVLLAMNTGHTGGFTTIHANGVTEIPSRLVSLGALGGLAERSVFTQAAVAFQVVIQLGRNEEGIRQLTQIGVLCFENELKCLPAIICTNRQIEIGPGITQLAWLLGENDQTLIRELTQRSPL